jgi:hypothetical protein
LAACGGDDDTAAASAGTQPSVPVVPAPAPPPSSAALTISRTAPAGYEWDDLAVGKAVHIDVTEEFTAVPGKYRGLKFLRTADADKFLSAANAIEFETNRDVGVIVAYDSEATSLPAWLQTWTDTGDSLTSSVGNYRLHRRQFGSGMVTLGGNELGALSYIVVVDDGSAVGNSAPTIAGIAPGEIAATHEYAFVPSAGDVDGDALTFTATNLPPWAQVDPHTGTLTGTPAANDVGSYADIVITVGDGTATAALPPFGILVNALDTNSSPVIEGQPQTRLVQNTLYEFVPTARDADGDTLTFSVSNLPRWASFFSSTGRVRGTPGAADAGTYAGIVISVSDGDRTVSLPAFTIVVTAQPISNASPRISGSPQASVVAGQSYNFTPTASDPDGDTLTFTIRNRPAWAAFNSATGRLSGNPAASHVGTYANVVITASDGNAQADLAAFTITVAAATQGNPTPSNSPPLISGNPPTTVVQGQAYSFTPSASDPDGNALTFSILNRPSWATFENSTGRLRGTPAAAGTHSGIVISVSDGQATRSLPSFAIAVTASGGSAPPANAPPQISGTPPTTVVQGQAYSFTPSASDPNGNALTFSIVNRPSWATFNTGTGRLSGTPSAAATHSGIVISVSDGQATQSLPSFTITVTASGGSTPPPNSPPSITGTPTSSVTQDQPYSFTPSASDSDGDALTFTIANRPPWATFSSSTGRLNGTPSAANVGTYTNIVITVSDGEATRSLPAFAITVNAITTGSATLSWTPPTQNTDGSALTNLRGYKIYWGRSSGSYTSSVTLSTPGLATFVVEGLTSGRWYFAASAVSSSGVESPLSNEASKTIP